MKKLFTMLVVSFCGTMAYAQTDAISVNDVTIAKGGSTQMEVTVNNAASNTAFQFDLKLPAGVSVKSATMNSGAVTSNAEDTQSRKLLHKLYTESDNVYRFLSYDNANAALTDGKVNITLEAAEEAETAEVEIAGSDILVVNPEGTSTTQANGDVASITVAEAVSITIPDGGKLAMVSDKNLDFSTAEGLTAYICTGFDVKETSFWLMPITDVPANTPIIVKGKAGDHKVAIGKANVICYPDNFLKGDATKTADVLWEDGYLNYGISQSSGKIGSMKQEKYPTLDAGKAYFHVPASVTSKVSDKALSFTMGKGKKLACVSDYDLDFSTVEGLQAFAVTAFDNGRNIWLMPVTNVSSGTPLVLRGESDKTYEVPSVATQMAYSNMLEGNNTGADMSLKPIEGDYTIYALSLGKGTFGTLGKESTFVTGKAWLPILTTFHNALPATSRGDISGVSEKIVDYIILRANDTFDDDATGISRVALEVENDVWYNLNGQRIDTPTRKGLYIKNGKKVIVK